MTTPQILNGVSRPRREFSRRTTHRIILADSRDMQGIDPESVDLMVTSPPYPMIQMWDDLFGNLNPQIKEALHASEGKRAFKLMHQILDKVWDGVYRVLKVGGFACINIGDATRKMGAHFSLYPNHSRITSYCTKIGFTPLPDIVWNKQTNAPNKFMGSGMLPAGAYVTLEHEYILIFRKGGKREFNEEERLNRLHSAYFWEERNCWFSDMWDFKGTRQELIDKSARERSAAFPFELPYRLINMYSLKGDTVLDPFLGTGTTMLAAMASMRNSIGIEIDPAFLKTYHSRVERIVQASNKFNSQRQATHIAFVEERKKKGKMPGYTHEVYNFPVISEQEAKILLHDLTEVCRTNDLEFEVRYCGRDIEFEREILAYILELNWQDRFALKEICEVIEESSNDEFSNQDSKAGIDANSNRRIEFEKEIVEYLQSLNWQERDDVIARVFSDEDEQPANPEELMPKKDAQILTSWIN